MLDVRDSGKVDAWVENSTKQLGGLNGAANIAGVEREGGRHLADSRNEDWDFVMGINCTGVFYCMRAQLNQMLNNGGSIVSMLSLFGLRDLHTLQVNISSVAGFIGLPNNGIYNASKHAVRGLTRTAAREYGGHNIRVNAVAPGSYHLEY